MTTQDRAILKGFAVSRELDAVKRLAEDMVKNWMSQIATGNNEFEYLKSSLERDGKVQGIKALLREIDLIASYD